MSSGQGSKPRYPKYGVVERKCGGKNMGTVADRSG